MRAGVFEEGGEEGVRIDSRLTLSLDEQRWRYFKEVM